MFIGALATAQPAGDASPSLAPCLQRARTAVLTLRGLPEQIRTDLAGRLETLVERDQKFQRSDNIQEPGLSRRRFVGAIEDRGIWVIVYEHGIIDHMHALKYVRQQRGVGPPRYVMVPNSNLIGPVCAIIEASFAAVEGPSAGHF